METVEAAMSLVLHYHPLSSYCWKVEIGLYELGIPFEARMVSFGDPDALAAFKALWPTAKIPLLEDTVRDVLVPETSIQLEYLELHGGGTGSLLPADDEGRLQARLWDRLFDHYVMTPMQKIVGDVLRAEGERDPRGVADAHATVRMAYDMVEVQLADGREWAVGEAFGMADCAAAPALFYAAVVEPFAPEQTKLKAYLERLLARPSVARAVDEARPWFKYYPFKERLPAGYLVEDAPA